MKYNLDAVSRPVVITPYQDRWPDEFNETATRLRSVLGDLADRIDHIGSTSVPGLAAKDVIDIQITVPDLNNMDAFCKAMVQDGGCQQRGSYQEDHIPVGETNTTPLEWRKRYFREPDGTKRTHIHVREQGRMNQIYALLFRDYLRNHPTSAKLYEQMKKRLSELFPRCIDAYLYIKDPTCDIIMQAAAEWRRETNWKPGPSDA